MIVKIKGPATPAMNRGSHSGFNGSASTDGSARSSTIKNLMNMNSFNLVAPEIVEHVFTDFDVEDKKQYFFAVMRKMVHDYPQQVQKLLKDSAGITSSVKKADLKDNLAIAIFNVPSFNYEFAKLVASVGVTGTAKYAHWEPNWGMVAAGNQADTTATGGNKDTSGGEKPAGMTKDAWDKIWGTVDRVSQIGLTVGGWFMDKNNGTTTTTTAQQNFQDEFKQFDAQQGGNGPDVFNILKWVGITVLIGVILYFGGKMVMKMLNK